MTAAQTIGGMTPTAAEPATPSPVGGRASARVLLLAPVAAVALGAAVPPARTPLVAGGVLLGAPILLAVSLLGRRDAVSILTAAALTLLLLPAQLVLPGLGGMMTPALVFGVAAAWWWLLGALLPATGAPGPQPVRRAAIAFAASMTTSYVAAWQRPLDPLEGRAADRGMLVLIATIGLCVLAADGIVSRERLETLLRRMVLAATVVAGIGIVQFTSGYDPATLIRLPGLVLADHGYDAITERSEFNRVAGTTLHPIELGVVLTMLLPIAIHLAWASPRRRRVRAWLPVGVLAVAVPMSVSRTGALALVVIGVLLVPTWSPRRRRRALVASIVFAGAIKILVPGLLGTLRALFLSLWVDPSVASRQQDYGYVGAFVADRPLFGRGFATFLPDRYDFLDNQYLLSLVETGLVGVVALAAVFLTAIGASRAVRRSSTDPVTRDLAQALVASCAVPLVACATFDFLSFPAARGTAFVLAGCAGALWRLEAAR